MATLRRRCDMGGKFELDYVDPVDGRRHRVDTHTRDPKIAQVWLKKAEELASLARLGVIPKVGRLTRETVAGKTMPEDKKRLRLDGFEKEYLDRGQNDLDLAKGTLSIIRLAFASIRKVVGNPFIDQLSDEGVRGWKRALTNERSKNTISMYLRALKAAFNRAVKWKFIKENPFVDVEVPSTRKDEKPRKAMDIMEVQTLLKVIRDPMFRRYVQFLLYTAGRRNEILYLRCEDLDLERRILYVQAEKTSRRLALPINRALLRTIEEMIQDNEMPESGYIFRTRRGRGQERMDIPWHPHSVTHLFKKAVLLASLPKHYSVHSCRHTYATYLRSKGIPQDVVQRLLGHASTRTTEIYDHADALFFRSYADMVDFENLNPPPEQGGIPSFREQVHDICHPCMTKGLRE